MSATLGIVVAVVSLLAGAITIWLFARPGVRRVRAAADAILGEEAVTDRAGNMIAPARPGLTHRITTVEQTLALLVETNERLDNHEGRIKVLEDARLERVVTQVESAQAWRAIANAAESTPEDDSTD